MPICVADAEGAVGAHHFVPSILAAGAQSVCPETAAQIRRSILRGEASRIALGSAGTSDLALSPDPADLASAPKRSPSQTFNSGFDKPTNAATIAILGDVAFTAVPTCSGTDAVVGLICVWERQHVLFPLCKMSSPPMMACTPLARFHLGLDEL